MENGGGAAGGRPSASLTDDVVLDVVLEGAEVGLWTLDLSTGRTETAGPYGRILTGRELPRGFSFADYNAFLEVVHPDDRQRIAGSVTRYRGSSHFEEEFRVIWNDGQVRTVLSRARIIPGDEGRPGRVVGVLLDITEQQRAARQREQLLALTETGLSRLGFDDLLTTLLQRVVELTGTDTGTILLVDADGHVRARATVGFDDPPPVVAIPIGEGFAGRIAATGEAMAIDLDEIAVYNPSLRARGLRHLLGVPLVVEGTVIGVLHVGTVNRPPDTADLPVLRTVADRVALAVDRARAYEHQRRIADTLQRSLLPYQLPEVPGIRLAAVYRPGTGGADVGGDWYDAVALADGRLVLTMGDVAGHGLESAHNMGRLRDVCRTWITEGRSIDDVLSRLNHITSTLSDADLATAVCVVIDPAKGTISWSNAGHPPPLLRHRDGTVQFLSDGLGPALGVAPGTGYWVAETSAEPGSTLVLYTDGLVERRDESMATGLARLADDIAGCNGASACCERLLDLSPADRERDDVAILAAELRPRVAPLAFRVPNRPEALADLRSRLTPWLATVADGRTTGELLQAVGEAAANAMRHARPEEGGEIAISATCAGDKIEICVRDWSAGGWEPGGTDHGRGLVLMEALTDELVIVQHHDGSEVVLRRTIP